MKRGQPLLTLQTKAQNLKQLQSCLTTAKVLPLCITSLQELKTDRKNVLEKIQSLKATTLIIRSSSSSEDNSTTSNAGAFLSLAHIPSDDEQKIIDAIQKVGESMPNVDDEILIQPNLTNIFMCGVGFSVDKENYAPYFCINYDKSGDNASITSGGGE